MFWCSHVDQQDVRFVPQAEIGGSFRMHGKQAQVGVPVDELVGSISSKLVP